MNEFEFEKLIKEAIKDESSPSDILNAKLKQKIKKKYFIQRSFRGIKTVAACIAVVVTGTLVLINSNEWSSNKLSDAPVVGNVAKVATGNDVNKKDEVSHDNDISYVTENKSEDVVENVSGSKSVVTTTKRNNKIKNTTQKSNKHPEKNVQTNITKTEELNDKIETEEIMAIPEVINDVMENNGQTPSMARSFDIYSDQEVEIESGDVQEEAISEIKESIPTYEKLSDLYNEGYDYRSEISEKIRNQVKERMTLNPEIKYNIDDDFTITGNEEFYINDKNELVIVFGEGDVAPEDLGKVEFNIGTIN